MQINLTPDQPSCIYILVGKFTVIKNRTSPWKHAVPAPGIGSGKVKVRLLF